MTSLHKKSVSSLSSNPLFSTIITLYTLILLYFPTFLFSPVFLSTSILILPLLKLAATQQGELNSNDGESNVDPNTEIDPEFDPNQDLDPFYVESFIEWNIRAPLEVIHEEYEDEKEIVMYYPDTDTDTSTDSWSEGGSPVIGKWDSPENLCFQWEEELIEIELDGKRNSEVEEENLIEIDLNPANFPAR